MEVVCGCAVLHMGAADHGRVSRHIGVRGVGQGTQTPSNTRNLSRERLANWVSRISGLFSALVSMCYISCESVKILTGFVGGVRNQAYKKPLRFGSLGLLCHFSVNLRIFFAAPCDGHWVMSDG